MDNQQVLVRTSCMIYIWSQAYMTMYRIDGVVSLVVRTCIVVSIYSFEDLCCKF